MSRNRAAEFSASNQRILGSWEWGMRADIYPLQMLPLTALCPALQRPHERSQVAHFPR